MKISLVILLIGVFAIFSQLNARGIGGLDRPIRGGLNPAAIRVYGIYECKKRCDEATKGDKKSMKDALDGMCYELCDIYWGYKKPQEKIQPESIMIQQGPNCPEMCAAFEDSTSEICNFVCTMIADAPNSNTARTDNYPSCSDFCYYSAPWNNDNRIGEDLTNICVAICTLFEDLIHESPTEYRPSYPYTEYPTYYYSEYPTYYYSEYPTYYYSEYPTYPYSEYPTYYYSEYPTYYYSEYPTYPYSEYPTYYYSEYPTYPYSEYPTYYYSEYPTYYYPDYLTYYYEKKE